MKISTGYSRTQIILHWVVVLLIAFQYLFHDEIIELFDARLEGKIENVPGFHPHAAIGMLILVLVLWRLVLRLTHGAPAAPATEPMPLVWLSKITHGLIYLLLLAMPITGVMAWVAGVEDYGDLHGAMKLPLLILIGLHILGALAHKFYFKTDVMERMLKAR